MTNLISRCISYKETEIVAHIFRNDALDKVAHEKGFDENMLLDPATRTYNEPNVVPVAFKDVTESSLCL